MSVNEPPPLSGMSIIVTIPVETFILYIFMLGIVKVLSSPIPIISFVVEL